EAYRTGSLYQKFDLGVYNPAHAHAQHPAYKHLFKLVFWSLYADYPDQQRCHDPSVAKLCYSPENPIESRAVVGVYQDKEPAVELKKRLKHCFKIVVQKGNHNSI